MNRPSLRPSAAAALLAALGAIAGPVAAQDRPFDIPGAAERRARVMEDARRLSSQHLPAPEELGPGWRRPWELPAGTAGAARSEDAFWAGLRPRSDTPAWHDCYGLTAAEARDLLRGPLEQMAQKLAALGPPPAGEPLAALATPPALLSLYVAEARMRNGPMYLSQPIFAVRHHDWLWPVIKRRRSGGERDQAEAILGMIDHLCPDLAGASMDSVLEAYVNEVTAVRRYTKLIYLHVADADLGPQNPGTLPAYGSLTVQVHVLDRATAARELRDPTAEDLAGLERDLAAWLDTIAADVAPERGVRYRVRCAPLQLGDCAWTAAIDGPVLEGTGMSGVFGRLRNGNAVVEVRGEGTHSSAWLERQAAALLAAVDERTALWRDTDWR
jgi:hypothetical protein